MPRCRRTKPIFSSGTPWRSISVAAVCRRTCAPLTGVTIAGPLHEALHHRRDAVTIPERPAWSDSAQEHAIALADGRSALEVGSDCIPDVLRKRQADLIARLARDPQRARLPLDVDETELRHVAGPQPEARQEQDDRAITPARDGFAITCSDQPVHLLRRQIPRHVGKPPIGVGRNDVVETCLAAAFDSEVPQERSQAGRQLLDGPISATGSRGP